MPRTLEKTIRFYARKIQTQLSEELDQTLERRKYKLQRDVKALDALDPRRNHELYFLRYRSVKRRPENNVFDHTYSFSITWTGLRLRVTTYCIGPKTEKTLVRILQKIATEHDIVIIVDVTQNTHVSRTEHWGKYRIAPKGSRRK